MPVRLNGSSSGYTELSAPATAGNNTLTLPTGNGTANQFLKNGSSAGALAWSTLTEDGSGNMTQNGYPAAMCRAFVNFNGTGTTGQNQTVRASLNVSSVLKNGTGDYTISFVTALADANYSSTLGVTPDVTLSGSNAARVCFIQTAATGSVRVIAGFQAGSGGSGALDFSVISVAVFR